MNDNEQQEDKSGVRAPGSLVSFMIDCECALLLFPHFLLFFVCVSNASSQNCPFAVGCKVIFYLTVTTRSFFCVATNENSKQTTGTHTPHNRHDEQRCKVCFPPPCLLPPPLFGLSLSLPLSTSLPPFSLSLFFVSLFLLKLCAGMVL